MAMHVETVSDRLAINVFCSDITSEEQMSKTFNELEESLEVVLSNLHRKEIHFFALNLQGKTPLESRLLPQFNQNAGKEYLSTAAINFAQIWDDIQDVSHNPWKTICPDFWLNASRRQAMRPRIERYVSKLAEVITKANQSGRSTDSLWEHDEVQFGEPLVTLLALHDIEFIPYYTSLLKLWDMGHEVDQLNQINAIVKKYGICTETTDLLFHRAFDIDAQWHLDQIEELLPIMQFPLTLHIA